jgi:hypothetical protein
MTVVRWRSVPTSMLLVGLLSACDNPDPLAPSFATARGAPAAPTNLTATALSYQDIGFAWQDNSTNEAGWEVFRSTTGPTGTFTLFTVYSSPNITQGANGGLQASTQYCYQVRAFSALGQSGKVRAYSDFSNTACATTPGLPVPAAPSNVSAAPDAWGRIRVTWTDNAADETGFRVERSATSSGPWTTLGTTGANAVSFDDWQPPTAEQPACYRLFAFNSFGDSPASNADCTTMPAAPSGLTAIATGSNVDLAWTDNSGVEDGFQVRRWTASTDIVVVATLPANATTYRDVGLADDTYWYQVLATKDGGTSGTSNNASAAVVTVPPASPSAADAVPAGSTVAAVNWVDNATNEAGFRVERSTDGGASWVVAGTAGADETWFYDSEQPSEQTLCYRVIAFNSLGDSPPSNADCTTLPAAPSNLVATPIDPQTVDLTWTDNSSVEDGYVVGYFYFDDYNWIWVFQDVADLPANATSYRLTWLASDTYYVVATKDGGLSDYAGVSVIGGAAPAAAPRAIRPSVAPRRPVSKGTRPLPHSTRIPTRP